MLITKIPVTGTLTTTDTEWVTVATCAIPSDCSILINDIFIIGRKTSDGATASAAALHRAKRVSSTLSLVGSIVMLLTVTSGSESGFNSHQVRIQVSGDDLQLQVQPGTADQIDWYGGFTAILN